MPGPALTASADEYAELQATLLNESGSVPLAKRFRALFTLRNLKTHQAIDIIGKGGLPLSLCPRARPGWTGTPTSGERLRASVKILSFGGQGLTND